MSQGPQQAAAMKERRQLTLFGAFEDAPSKVNATKREVWNEFQRAWNSKFKSSHGDDQVSLHALPLYTHACHLPWH